LFQEYYDAGAEGYDLLFGRVPRHFANSLVRAARLKPGQRVLDIATGTGLVANAVANVVGVSGHVVAADISPSMLAVAERRLSALPNVSIEVGDGQALRFADGEFDAVVCSLALMLFPDPARGVSEIYRVLQTDGWAAVSVETTAERSLTTRINAAIGRHVASRAAAAASYYSLGQQHLLGSLLTEAGFSEVEVFLQSHRFSFSSFEAYFGPITQGAGSVGAEFMSLSADLRQIVRENIRRELEGPISGNGPVEINVEILFAAGVK
jgi:ubiquinone/menaquinone biosynthesis C-methylase UbiE